MKIRYMAWLCAALGIGVFAGAAHAADAPWPRTDAGGWQYLSESEDARGYIRPAEDVGHPRIWFRVEYRTPTMRDGLKTASGLILAEFNCSRRTSRDLSVAGYPRNNMKGKAVVGYPGPAWEAVAASGAHAETFAIACADHEAKPPAAWTPLRTGEWELLEDEDHMRILRSYGSPLVYPRVWSRVELRDAQDWNNRPYRSSQQLHEFDCAGGRARTIFNVRYPDHNLQGAPDMSAGYLPWSKPGLGAPLAYMLRMACAEEEAAIATPAQEGGQPYETAAATRRLDRPFRFVKDEGWAAMALNKDFKTLVRGSNGGTYPLVEVRREFLRTQTVRDKTFRSIWTLTELDCLVGRHRPLKSIYYSKSNLTGAEDVVDTPGEWLAFENTSDEYAVLDAACNLGIDEDGDPINPEGMSVPAREGGKQ